VSVLNAQGRVVSCAVEVKKPLRAALFVPEQELSTAAARAVLPPTVTLADAVFNLGRAALFVAALAEGRHELLAEAMEDRLHQGPRSQLLPWLPGILEAAREAGAFGAALSGAGTTVCALCDQDNARDVARAIRDHAFAHGVPGRAEVVDVGVQGAHVQEMR
jgi:homoserine kinase